MVVLRYHKDDEHDQYAYIYEDEDGFWYDDHVGHVDRDDIRMVLGTKRMVWMKYENVPLVRSFMTPPSADFQSRRGK